MDVWRKRVYLGYVGEKVALTDKDVRRVVVNIAGDIGNGSDKGTRWMEDDKLTFWELYKSLE